jgi:hypothetical protein
MSAEQHSVRESGSYSVPPRKNLAIILSRSLEGICPGRCSFLTNRNEKICEHFHVTFCLCPSGVFQNFLIRAPPSFGGYPPYSNHSVRPHFLSYNNSWSHDLVYYFEWQKCQYIPEADWRFHVSQVSVKAVVHGTQRIWFIFSPILF